MCIPYTYINQVTARVAYVRLAVNMYCLDHRYLKPVARALAVLDPLWLYLVIIYNLSN